MYRNLSRQGIAVHKRWPGPSTNAAMCRIRTERPFQHGYTTCALVSEFGHWTGQNLFKTLPQHDDICGIENWNDWFTLTFAMARCNRPVAGSETQVPQ